MKTLRFFIALTVSLILVAACRGGGQDEKPTVKILSPPNQNTLALGETLMVESRARDDGSVRRVELRINGRQAAVAEIPGGEKSLLVEQSWLPPEEGIFYVTVVAYDNKNQESEPAAITIFVQPAPTTTATPRPPTPAMVATATFPAPPEEGTPEPTSCNYDAAFVSDVTIPDDTPLTPGTDFVKIWRLRNTGTCDWGKGFQFIFVQGEQMNGPAWIPVPPTASGDTLEISAPLKAPEKPGTYRGTWRIRTPEGEEFGDRPFVKILVPAPTPESTPTATVAPKPDLDITLVSGNLELLVNELLQLRVTVSNHGPGATDRAALVRAVLGGGTEIESSVASLPAGAEEDVLLEFTFAEPAALEVVISVDPGDEIAEGDETNNSERVPLIVDPPLYISGTITTTVGLSFDVDDAVTETEKLDFEWQMVEGTVFLRALNGAGAALLSGEVESVSYTLVAGLNWTTERLALSDLAAGFMFGFRTSDGRVGYARVEEVLDEGRTSARLSYRVWDWP